MRQIRRPSRLRKRDFPIVKVCIFQSAEAQGSPYDNHALVAFSEIVAALTYALDLTARGTAGHTLRACVLGMRIGSYLQLDAQQLSDLYYALLLKDAGCSTNAAAMFELMGMDETLCKYVARTFDWTRFEWRQVKFLATSAFRGRSTVNRIRGVLRLLFASTEEARHMMETRCQAGAEIVHDLGLRRETGEAICSLDEHWDGSGHPRRLRGHAIPVLSQIANLAQNLELFEKLIGREGAVATIQERSGRWFDPMLARKVMQMHEESALWTDIDEEQLMPYVVNLEPSPRATLTSAEAVDAMCVAFAEIIDAKSHYTYVHSQGVTSVAEGIGQELQLSAADMRTLRRAALLHDIGKLAIPNTILDKPGKLTQDEWVTVKRHPAASHEVLLRIPGFKTVAQIAREHHERLDGSGYPDGLAGTQLCLLSRILAVADTYDALTSPRPYRNDLTQEEIVQIIEAEAPHKLDPACVAALWRRNTRQSACTSLVASGPAESYPPGTGGTAWLQAPFVEHALTPK